ncbi:MAG TPA: tetratricopeptide repeat protein [Pyrinomonadaceae bacterium]|jgi:tetratricopeptide (TPR) repeat protein|nr:tetratricopeptide repeat protein [Pyrinomonadaceae bacterium]
MRNIWPRSVKVAEGRSPASLRSSILIALVLFSPLLVKAQTPPTDSAQISAQQLATLIEQVRAGKPADQAKVSAALKVGYKLLAAARYREAWAIFEAVLEVAPRDAWALYGGALALFNLREIKRAEQLARAAFESANAALPDTAGQKEANVEAKRRAADALVLLGVILAVEGDAAAALKTVEQAVALAPDNFDAQFALGRSLYGAGDLQGAVKSFRAAVALRPEDAKARFFLATALEGAGETESALAAYRELLALQPDSADGHLGLGALLVKLGGDRTLEGTKELMRAVSLNGDLYEARITLGRTLVRLGRAEEAVEHLERAAALAPRNPEPHYQLALAYRRLGKLAQAERENEIVKEIHAARRGNNPETSPGTQSRDQNRKP